MADQPIEAWRRNKQSDEDGMSLPEGKTCADCFHFERCTALFNPNQAPEVCDFAPSQFEQRGARINLGKPCRGYPSDEPELKGRWTWEYQCRNGPTVKVLANAFSGTTPVPGVGAIVCPQCQPQPARAPCST